MNAASEPKAEARPQCGVVMPISAIDGCPESHWLDVRAILYEAVKEAEFEPNIVSDADEIGVIQKRIIQNLYQNPIIVCDISAKNPNVMFELGIRLAFDKPTIIVKDDKTSYSFDTSPIEHLTYPRDLRFSKIIEFKEQLSVRIKATFKAATSDPDNFTTFLKHFGTFTVAKLESKEVSSDEIILNEIRELRQSVIARSPRRDLEPPRPVKLTSDRYEEMFDRYKREIKKYLTDHGLTRKAEIRAAKDMVRDKLETKLGPEYFHSPVKYRQFFDGVFSLMYE